ncbi:replication protein [Streptococcus constellatus]|uniref:Replication protein RepB n=2 Tax=Streptococcus TaxID=1301 RepID=A0A0C1HN17_STRCV|nr:MULTISPECIES: replication protein [Streptococcus]HEO3117676.1 replication protein [Streptococcus agalactiae]EFW08337.1 plasmid replication protein [Streptococcus anginosus 1_2_62CV]KIC78679.1 Replication protein RepB [Streptococcus constellatus]MBW3452688.1 replication protein [Streptococcus constellatus]MCW1052371.1 replication protein [Streptococcus anginosus]
MPLTKRSNKWAFLLYKESAPENYLDILEEMQVPYILSPWHDKDVDKKTGELLKAHKHGALFFDSLKSYTQVSELLTENLNTPKRVQIVLSPKGMLDYFTHAQNPDKTPYNAEDIESGAGFDLDQFLVEQQSGRFINEVIDLINDYNFTEFQDLVIYARHNDPRLLTLIMNRTYFFTKFIESKRYRASRHIKDVTIIDQEMDTD